MTDLLSDVDAPSDAELISRVRGGDVAAYGELFSRHKDAASRLAKQLVRGPDADDLVSEAFAKVLTVLQGGGGPDVAFRAYLLTAVRRLHVDRVRAGQRLQTTDDMTPFDPGVPFKDTAVAGFETGAAAQAFASLPERWQLVLWHLEVEGQKPADIAPLLGMSANSVSALAYRAREGLRQAFLTMHLSDISESDCRWVNEHLGAFVRKGLSKRDAVKVQNHLDGCRRCTAMYLELADVNSNLAGIIGPLLLGAAAAGYLASAGAGIGAGGVVSILSRTKDFVAANTGAVAAGAVATGVAAAAVAAVVVTQVGSTNTPDVVANPPASTTSALPSGSPSARGPSANASGSSSPSASLSTPTLSASTSPTASTSASTSPSAAASLSPGLALLPSLAPSESSSVLPSGAPSETAPGGGSSSPPPTEEPPPTEPPPPPPPVADFSFDSTAGTVTVHVTNVGLGDNVGIAMQSHETTFATPPDGCVRDDGNDVTCFPGGAGGGVAAAAEVSDYTATLPLQFPDSMVDDDLTISVKVNGDRAGPDVNTSFRPARTPIFDFSMPSLGQPEHTLGDTDGDGTTDVDRYDFSVTPQMPERVQGLQFRLSGDARFRSTDDVACSVGGDDAKTLTCPDATDGSALRLPVAADSLTTPADITIAVSPLVTFDDPTPGNDDSAATLSPGADLSLPDLHVFSMNPDRNGLVALQGSLAGVRPGMSGVTYDLQGGATFPDTGNPGCTPTGGGAKLACDDASNGAVALTIRADDPRAETDVTVGVTPNAPFVAVGSGQGTTLRLPGRPTHDFSLTGLRLADNGHNVSGDTDVYRLTGTVGPLPTGVDTLDFAVDGATVDTGQADPRCARVDDGVVRCTDLGTDPNPVLTLTSTNTTTHTVTVTVQPADPYDDPDSSNDSGSVSVSPGVNLTLANAADGSLSQGDDGAYHARVLLGGVRKGMPSVFLDLGDGATLDEKQSGCVRVSDTRLRCDNPTNGQIPLSIKATDPDHPTSLSVTATPGGDFEQLSGGNVAQLTLRAFHDFSIGALTRTGQSVNGDTDHYTLHTTIGSYPKGVGPLTFIVAGGQFAADQPDCAFVDATHVTCGDGPVDFAVESTSTQAHDVRVSLQTPAGYDDPDPTNDSSSVTVQPGVDLRLADLDPDNESPANDDRMHRVATRLDGTRKGLASVTYTLTGNATFVSANVAGCTASGKTLTCTNPSDGPITFTVRADDVHVATDIRIAVSPADPFVELDNADNSDGVRLLPRPTYDFSMGALFTDAHSVTGGTDHYTLSSTIGAVPTGVPGLTFTVTGGTFATDQDTGCSRVDSTHVTCTDLGAARSVGFRVDSTSDSRHDIGIALGVPSAYDDTNDTNDKDSVSVSPGIDLAMSALTPAAPTPNANGTYTVTSTLTGVRSGAVRFAVTGNATVTGSSCTVTTGKLVTCNAPSDGQQVSFTLRPTTATNATAVTITAQPADQFTELDQSDNAASTTLAPDVVLSSLSVRSDLLGRATVRAQITGVPSGTSVVRLGLSGADAGLGGTQVHLTNGADGADGQGPIDCYTSDAGGAHQANGLYATCTNVSSDGDGSFYVDMILAHPPGQTSNVTVTVIPVGVDQGSHGRNDSLGLTLH